MHRRTFLQSLCVLAAGLAASSVSVPAPQWVPAPVIDYGAEPLALTLDEYTARVLAPVIREKAQRIADAIDAEALTLYRSMVLA